MLEAKSKDALRTIGEVALETGVAPHVIRFWESKFLHIKPQKRRGRRYYSADDTLKIKTIKALLYEQGYTIRGVHKFLKGTNKPLENNMLRAVANNFEKDLFGNVIIPLEKHENTIPEFGAVEIAKLWQIYRGLCTLRNRLNLPILVDAPKSTTAS